MAFVINQIDSDLASALLSAVGVNSPSADEAAQSERIAALATSAIKHLRCQEITDDLEAKYFPLALEMSVYAWNKVGADGTLSFSENGISRMFTSESFPASMLGRVTIPVRGK